MANEINRMNVSLYNASMSLMEAGKFLSNVEIFKEESIRLFIMAEEMLSIIQPETEKITEEKMNSILDEIMNFSENKINGK
jgi:hypothetical protein